jgi:hypothetical protein
MNVLPPKKIVLLGMLTKIPVAGAVWGAMHYLIGFRRLGYDAYYVEAHARTPTMLMKSPHDDSTALAVAFLGRVMRHFDFDGKWAFHALHDDGRCHGMTEGQLKELYRSAALIINYHGATVPLPEHAATGRLIYLETDPVELEVELYHNDPKAIAFLEPHVAFFSWGLNYGNPDCRVPLPARFPFRATRPPVVPDLWGHRDVTPPEVFTTVGNWRQGGRVRYLGEVYTWSKHFEFLKFLGLPRRTGQAFELALSSYQEADRRLLEHNGWRVRNALEFSSDPEAYRRYVCGSRGEFTVAKDQNVRLRSGWFSERSAQYLAAGRPVITQETGFSNALPTGRGLFAFSTLDDAARAVESVNGDYAGHAREAAALARDCFSYRVVLKAMLDEVGL